MSEQDEVYVCLDCGTPVTFTVEMGGEILGDCPNCNKIVLAETEKDAHEIFVKE